ncbi:MAG: bifunctional (p)ppGpp synthetase/guanosine-3',5'-bis(diphosphate) 3'-pyrophosphohydrolase [Acidimicrobiales bacterium]|nr:bifunctional (p)ppGpp synthetase/guanosine-3',5'-bis(diphosphate) 3'-pyrophosphohydrolase [Acidimicrobiales bacterium]
MASTITRVLPWRRNRAPAVVELTPLVRAFHEHHPDADTSVIEEAYELAKSSHDGQLRKSGEPYVAHPLAVAQIVAGLGLDDVTVAAALLHDAVEDTSCTLEQLEERFGAEVAAIVDGVTKLDRIKFESKEQQQAASMRKLLVAVAKDLRVLIIKLCDRLHNMRTLAALPQWKQHRQAQETLDIYAPLAHRLGIQEVKSQLEDLAFAALHPKRYAEIDHMVAQRDPEREIFLAQVVADVQARLIELGISADVYGRPKHLYSIYEKMVLKGKEFDEIHDLVGLRVIVGSVKDCYAALGSIHASWKPVQGRFKDYIAMPKFNLYQSLHTTVVGPQGKPLEVQIRTREMHSRAEYGIAAHWDYKDPSAQGDLAWLSRIVELQQDASDPTEFMAALKTDLEDDEVFVFTPQGRVIALTAGATPVDFAYSVHTEVGHACRGARVNGRLIPLDTQLTSGDTIEIHTSKLENAGPSQDWLKFVATHRARTKIKQWHSRERREDAIAEGRIEIEGEFRREGLPVQKVMGSPVVSEVATALNYQDLDSMYAAIGDGHVSAKSVAQRVAKTLRAGTADHEEQLAVTMRQRSHRRRQRRSDSVAVVVEGLDDVLVRLAKCCTPVPPDEIMGFITRGRGVSVHRADCANAVSLALSQSDRLIEVEWDDDSVGDFVATIEVKAFDRTRLLRDITNALSDERINILAANTRTGDDRISVMRFEFELGDASHLEALIGRIKRIDSVYDAYRVVPGKGG